MLEFLAQVTFVQWLIYFGIGLVVWYFAYGLDMYLNGGRFGRGRWWVLECFWEEARWFLPGGLAKRAEYIRARVQSDTWIGGYSAEDIRTQNLYKEVAKRTLGNGCYFWGVNVMLCFFLWPMLIVGLAVSILLSPAAYVAERFFGK